MSTYSVIWAREVPAFERMYNEFYEKGYSRGSEDETPIYVMKKEHRFSPDLKVGHYIYGIKNCILGFSDVPQRFRTREFFLHVAHESDDDASRYVQAHIDEFDKDFFKDSIATSEYSISFDDNIFEWMPLEYIDEEMAMCAMFESYGRWTCDGWLFSIYKRKPEVLTREIFILSARCFSLSKDFAKKMIKMTPAKYRTREFYQALCYHSDDSVMELVPKKMLTNRFLLEVFSESHESIKCFTEEALEREVISKEHGKVKMWQLAVLEKAEAIRSIELNDERVEFFMALYDKDSFEYDLYFRERYRAYRREKNGITRRNNSSLEASCMMTLAVAMAGGGMDAAIDAGTKVAAGSVNREAQLPIKYRGQVPAEYSKKYDKDEYLLEIYKKYGIEIVDEADYYYYGAILPETVEVAREEYGYSLKCGNETILHYRDVGPFYDRDVDVDEIFVTL